MIRTQKNTYMSPSIHDHANDYKYDLLVTYCPNNNDQVCCKTHEKEKLCEIQVLITKVDARKN